MEAFVAKLKQNLSDAIEAQTKLLSDSAIQDMFAKCVSVVVESYKEGGRLYIAGNGGSAADAQHLAAEFVSKLARDRIPLPAEALTVDTSAITAIGNDYGYEYVFSRQLEAKATSRDVFLAITTSGQSPNILKALEKCKSLEIPSILLSGRGGGAAKDKADFTIAVPGETTSVIQEQHIIMYHTLCGCVEEVIVPE